MVFDFFLGPDENDGDIGHMLRDPNRKPNPNRQPNPNRNPSPNRKLCDIINYLIDLCLHDNCARAQATIEDLNVDVRVAANPWVWKMVEYAALNNDVNFLIYLHCQDKALFDRSRLHIVTTRDKVSEETPWSGFDSPFVSACSKPGNVNMIKYLLKFFDPNSPDKKGLPLFKAAKHGDLPMMQALVKAGATSKMQTTNRCNFTTYRPLLYTLVSDSDATYGIMERGDFLGRVQLVLKLKNNNKVDPDEQVANGRTALCIAAYKNDADVVKLLLDAGADKSIETRCEWKNAFGAVNARMRYEDRIRCPWSKLPDSIHLIPDVIWKEFELVLRMLCS